MNEAIIRLMTKLLPESLRNNRDSQIEAIVLLFILMSNTLICLLFIPIIIWVFDFTSELFELSRNLLMACIATYAVAFVILNRFGNIIIAGNISLVAVYVSSTYAGWYTGGVYSPIFYLLMIPPVFAFVLTNVASGVIWFIITMITFFTVWALDEFGIAEPVYLIYNPYETSLMGILLPVTTCGMLMIAITIYEMNRFKLRKMLAHERNLLAFKATHDPLTGLVNREEFNTQMLLAIQNAKHLSQSLTLIYIDLDGFKSINDTIGHHAGDKVLEVISDRLMYGVRGTDTVARLGGDEFAIIFRGIGDEKMITPILTKVLNIISLPIGLDEEQSVEVYGSIGVAFLDREIDDQGSLCRNADKAMYEAKETKNTWCFYNDAKGSCDNTTSRDTIVK